MKSRTARQGLFVAAMLGVSSLSVGQELAPAVRFVNPASIQVQPLTSAQLADLVAPIALYPDSLLSQVLVASTYPLDVVQAQQWLQRNGRLQGQALMDAARLQPWDASVQGLVAFPDALATLNEDVQWMTSLGNAFLAQEADVMAAVQDLRVRAQAAGRLASSPQQTVSIVAQEGQTVVEIVPADPQVIYVPAYDPYYVWGAPAWGAYPPLSYGYGYGFGVGVNVGFWFGGWSWGWGWGWGPNWYGGSVWVDRAFFRHCGYNYGHHGGYYGGSHGGSHGGGDGGHQAGGHSGRESWKHDAGQRRGVPYGNGQEAGRNRGGSQASGSTLTRDGSTRRSGNLSANAAGDRAASAGLGGGVRDEGWRTSDRTRTLGSRSTVPDSGRRTASGTIASVPRSSGADRGWSSSAERERGRSQGLSRSPDPATRPSASSRRDTSLSPRGTASQPRSLSPWSRGMGTSQRSQATAPRSSASSSRGSAPSPGYSAPSRSSSRATSGYSAPSRSYSAPSSGYSAPSRSSSRATSGYSAPSRSGYSGSGGRSSSAGSQQRSTGGSGSRGSSGGRSSSGGSGGGSRRH